MVNQTKKILIVDDEEVILELLQYNLEKEGYQVLTANNGNDALLVAQKELPDLILMDVMMPGKDGVETCREIRQISELSDVFVIFLTARSEEYSEIAAFEVGADDYITKPIKPRALMSRISAFFRRGNSTSSSEDQLTIGELEIDKTSYTVKVDSEEVVLPKKEFELLYFLMKSPNKVFNREELLQNIWGADVYVLARTVDVHIRKIREKIGEDYIKTIKGVGYKFNS